VEILSTDPDRPGIFAIGQEAYGIFALGQMATGVIAIGQVARGVIAIGQGAVGAVAIGQGALGIFYAGGMIAVGARGFGLCLKLLPQFRLERFPRPDLPPLTPFSEVKSGAAERAWVLARIEAKGGEVFLEVDGEPLAVEHHPDLVRSLHEAYAQNHTHACVTIDAEERMRASQDAGYREAAPRERVLIGKRMTSWREAQPRLHMDGPHNSALGLFLGVVGVCLCAVAWWFLAGHDIAALFIPASK
jgi:hypothetical protein